ncbi:MULTISPECIES: hypothetical protein [unclassified Methylophaga]|jgi:hypothetical protein|uniref:hypothetical protein n=1 Tax=unclassified Methylophaga TaxID=2629249 RepID=UPI000C8B7348|nr:MULTISPECIES: hypothetical protein [unclassified Methylophaga]MAK65629.1 hypothetical protein [Methylophaga sp.]MAY16352.1 hypothetical protein [Methylophaga sp.]HAO23529.1 hypothetical protein [Methylophaga sp.]HCD06568.1 hypothetical protein [Methylophaga sp.]|tara:strand:- start:33026 stop:33316 length:291 start_codon:yes stop_codon:yes gene_type:complete
MLKTIMFTITFAFASIMLSGCSDEQEDRIGQDNELNADPEWSENPYGDEEGQDADNPQSTDEMNRNKDDDDLNEPYPDEDPAGLEEAAEQGISQQY